MHPIKPVESKPLKNFIKNNISNRSKETLFLVLTHAGLYSDSDTEKLHSEAIRLYKDDIPEERILVVDSLLKLIYNDLEGGKTLEQIEESSENKSDILPKFEKKSTKQNKELKDVLLEYSRFEKMDKAIEDFSMQVPNLRLQEILESIKKGYEYQNNQYKEDLELLDKKKRNPPEFEAEINRIHNALSKYKNLMYKTKKDLDLSYNMGKHSEWSKDIDELKIRYPELISKSTTLELARKHYTDATNEIESKRAGFSSSLTAELSKRLEEVGKTFKEEHKITVPKVDLKCIEDKAKKNAYRTEDVTEPKTESVWENWNTLKLKWSKKSRTSDIKTGEIQVYDEEQHLSSLKALCNVSFYEQVNKLPAIFKKVLNTYLTSFNNEMNAVIAERQKSLENEKDKKQSNDKIIADIDYLKVKKKLFNRNSNA